MRWNSRGGYEDVGFCWVLERGIGRSAEEALRGVGLGVKVFGGCEGDGLVAAWSMLGDERILPHRAAPLKPTKDVPPPEASFGRRRAVLTSSNSSPLTWSDSSSGAGPPSSSFSAECGVDSINCDTDELDSVLPDSKRNGLALIILWAELVFWYTAKAVLAA